MISLGKACTGILNTYNFLFNSMLETLKKNYKRRKAATLSGKRGIIYLFDCYEVRAIVDWIPDFVRKRHLF
jgi:hypothetical protein